MQDPENRISRRTALKGAAVSGLGIVVGSSLAKPPLKQVGVSRRRPSWNRTTSGSHNGRGA